MRILVLGILFFGGSILAFGSVSGVVTVENGVSNKTPVVVYIEKAAEMPIKPALISAKMAQKNETFLPESLVVIKGQKIDFPNQDQVFHNIFSVTPGNEFDLGLYRGGVSKSIEMQTAGEVNVYCNIHPNMEAKILVLQNPFYTTISSDGTFKISDIPGGDYTLVAWSALHEPIKKRVSVYQGNISGLDFKLKLRSKIRHLNKNGEQYGRYK